MPGADVRAGDRRVGCHVFGPLSDLGTPVWNLLLIPLLLTFYPLLKLTRFGRALTAVTVVLAVAGAASSALLVTKTLTFAISTPITVIGVLVQGLWLFTLTRRMRAVPGWPRWVLRLGLFIPVAQAIGAALVGISLAFGWGSVPQIAIMAIGLVAGVPAWAAWPVWVVLVGRFLASADRSTAAEVLDLAIMIIGLVPGVAAYASWPAWFTLIGRNLRPSSAGNGPES